MTRLALIAARALLAIAAALFLAAVTIAAAALILATLPYRKLKGPSIIGARLAATQQIALALAAIAATRRREGA